MRIRDRLSIWFMLVMLVPLLVVSGVAAWQARRELKQSTGGHLAALAAEKADAIAMTIHNRIHEASVLAATHEVRQAVREANAAYEDRDDQEITDGIAQLDAEWIETKRSGGSPTAKRILGNRTSNFLKTYQMRNSDRYGEIFLTDVRGAAIGQTMILSDYNQADESWWQAGLRVKEGSAFIDDRGYDETADALAMGIVVPVFDGDRPAGVLKINYKVREALDIVAGLNPNERTTALLVRSLGTIVAHSGEAHGDTLTTDEKAVLSLDSGGFAWYAHEDERYVMGYSPVAADISARIPNPGERKGISGEKWMPSRWWLMIQVPHAVALAAVGRFTLATLTGALVALLCAIGMALIAARSFSSPIQKLREGADAIGHGDFEHRVGTAAKDEIGQLSRAFDAMVDRLKSVMAHRDELDREIHQRKLAETQLRDALRELKRSNEDLEQFAYSASHDLQEPLRKVTAFGSLLEKEAAAELTGDSPQYMASMLNATRRMQTLISDLLSYSRVTRRSDPFTPTDMDDVVQGVLSDLEIRIKETGATVDVGKLPTIEADATQMRQIMQNLIGNALKFQKDGVKPHIRIYAESPSPDGETTITPQCRLVVEDNGIGFEKKFVAHIFGVFQRLHSRQQYSGSGIGLAVCRRIAERHGGTIVAESELGEGTKFTVSLPLQHSTTDAEA
jgi:signal transduction histidine kinase